MTDISGMGGSRGLRASSLDRSVATHKLKSGTVRRILTYAAPFKKDITIFLGLILLNALAGAAQPLMFKAIIDDGILTGRSGLVIGLAIATAGLAVATGAIGLTQRYFSARIGQGVVHNLRTEVFEHVQRQPIAFFSRAQTGALVSRLNGDVRGAQQAFTSMLSTVVGNIATTVTILAAMMVLSWQITIVALAAIPLFLLPARFAGRKLAELTRERYSLTADLGQTMTERFNVAGAMLVKLYGRPDAEAVEFAERAGRVRDIGVTTAVYSRILSTAMALLAAFTTAVVYGIGGLMAIGGTLGVGTIVALTAYLARLYGPITSLSNLQVDIMTTLVSFERVLEVLDLEPMVSDAPGAIPLPPEGAATVELDHVGFTYPAPSEVSLASLESVARLSDAPSGPVLEDISFTVEPGQMVALVGPSGAGKTTITSLITRLYDVTGGAVRVGGVDVRDLDQQSLHDAIGVVSQDAHLFHTTLRTNLAYAKPDATEVEMWDALRGAQVAELVDSFPDGLDTVVGDRGYRLSGGEKQRLSIARLLLKAPQIVILDEATAHLDSESEAAVARALREALAGRTSIVIAHRLSTVREADQIVVVDGGRAVERGTHAELLGRDGLYADLYRTQFAVQSEMAVAR
jgi:ATP-binding cassette, subfamily B, bacterial